jgi:hypothetical protein
MTQAKKLLAEIISIVESKLKRLGFRKTKSIYVCPLAEDACGWLGLSTATHRSDGRVGINPVVGVRHERIEKMLEDLLRESRASATISIPLGYLTPDRRFLEWLFEPPPFDCRSECERMVQTVELYGIPFMKSKNQAGRPPPGSRATAVYGQRERRLQGSYCVPAIWKDRNG